MPPLLPCLALLLAVQATPGAKPSNPVKLAADSMEVSARKLIIPPLPENVQAAHSQNGELRPRVFSTLKDLEQDLLALYAMPEVSSPLPASLKVKPAQAEEVKFLSSMLQDSRYEELQAAVNTAWARWQKGFVEMGLGDYRYQDHELKMDPDEMVALRKTDPRQQEVQEKITGRRFESPRNNLVMNLQPTEEEKKIARQIKQYGPAPTSLNLGTEPLNARVSPIAWDAEKMWLVTPYKRFVTLPNGEVVVIIDWDKVHALKGTLDWMQKRVALAAVARRVSNQEAPQFSKLWQPLADHLNASAKRLMDYELAASPQESPELHALRLQAKAAFLERFRSSLWFGGMVQSYMTSQAPPEVPRDLRPSKPASAGQATHS